MRSPATRSLPGLPDGWDLRRIGHVGTAWTSNVDKHAIQDEPAVRLCNYTDVYKNDVITADLDFMRATARPDQVEKFRLRLGDTVITKDSETADDIGIPAFVAVDAHDLVCGYHLAIMRPDPRRIEPKYLYWALASKPTLRQWELVATGVTRVGIRSTDLGKAELAIPPLGVQQAIADYLDRETAKIDTLIKEQQRLIDLLRERRQAVIDGSVDGLPGSHRMALKFALAAVDQGVSPQAEAGLANKPGSWGVLKAGCVNHGIFRQEEHKRLPVDYDIADLEPVACGDVIVSRASGTANLVGSCAIVPALDFNLILSDKLFRLKPSRGTDSRFLVWLLNGRQYRHQVLQSTSGAEGLANNLPLRALRSFELHFPPLAEQRRIADYIDE